MQGLRKSKNLHSTQMPSGRGHGRDFLLLFTLNVAGIGNTSLAQNA
jgi:hypothetical protein